MATAELVHRYRVGEKALTRHRQFPFHLVLLMSLRRHKFAIQHGLKKLFRARGTLFHVPTASASSQARQNRSPDVVVHRHQVVQQACSTRYGAEHALPIGRGPRVRGADGTSLHVPDTPATRTTLSLHTHQHHKAGRVQA